MTIDIGRVVRYLLSDQDAREINRRRTTGEEIASRIRLNHGGATFWPLGAQAHIGNKVSAGKEFPMMVVDVDAPLTGVVSGQVFLDGNDVLWVKHASEGTENGTWQWPEIAK